VEKYEMTGTDTDTDRWVKDTLLSHTEVHSRILNKLEQGEDRMARIEKGMGCVVEATQALPALKIDVTQLKKAEELRKKEEEFNLRNQLETLEARQAMWGQRFWELFVKSLPFLLLGAMFIYSHVKDQL